MGHGASGCVVEGPRRHFGFLRRRYQTVAGCDTGRWAGCQWILVEGWRLARKGRALPARCHRFCRRVPPWFATRIRPATLSDRRRWFSSTLFPGKVPILKAETEREGPKRGSTWGTVCRPSVARSHGNRAGRPAAKLSAPPEHPNALGCPDISNTRLFVVKRYQDQGYAGSPDHSSELFLFHFLFMRPLLGTLTLMALGPGLECGIRFRLVA